MQKSKISKERVAKKWAESEQVYIQNDFKVYWECSEIASQYQLSRITGQKSLHEYIDWLEYLTSFFPKNKKFENMIALIIGCNLGEDSISVILARTNFFKKIIIVDISDNLLKQQREILKKIKLNHFFEFQCLDLDVDSLPHNHEYDLICSLGTIHHIQRLEGLFDEINMYLRDDGIFAMREYIGPSYLQFTDKQIQIANLLLESLPDYMKVKSSGEMKTKPFSPTFDEVYNDDPSEAIRSDDIMDIVRNKLCILAENMTGGTLLNPLMNEITENFEKGNEEKEILRHIIMVEHSLIQLGVISSDYVFLVANKSLNLNA